MITNLPGTGEPGSVDWTDMDNDGDLDVLLGGTYLMRNDGNGNFSLLAENQSGLELTGMIRDIVVIKGKAGDYLLFLRNSEQPVLFELKKAATKKGG